MIVEQEASVERNRALPTLNDIGETEKGSSRNTDDRQHSVDIPE